MIAQGFEFTRDFLKEWNNSAYFRLKKISCEFKAYRILLSLLTYIHVGKE